MRNYCLAKSMLRNRRSTVRLVDKKVNILNNPVVEGGEP